MFGKTKIKAKITIVYPNGFEKVEKVEMLDAEQIVIKSGKQKGKILYCGVHPKEQINEQNRKYLMYYARFGYPFTFDSYTARSFTDEKKKAILIKKGLGIPIKYKDKEIIILLDKKKMKEGIICPEWRKNPVPNFEPDKMKTLDDLIVWLKANPKAMSKTAYADIPAYTEHDVSDVDMIQAENFAIIKSKAIKTAIEAMENVGGKDKVGWYFVGLLLLALGLPLMFFYFLNDGAFNQPVKYVEKPIEEGLRNLTYKVMNIVSRRLYR